MLANMLYFYTIYTNKIIDKSMCACFVLNMEGFLFFLFFFIFFNQRSFRASCITDLMHAHDRQKLRLMCSVFSPCGCAQYSLPCHLPSDVSVPRNSTNPKNIPKPRAAIMFLFTAQLHTMFKY